MIAEGASVPASTKPIASVERICLWIRYWSDKAMKRAKSPKSPWHIAEVALGVGVLCFFSWQIFAHAMALSHGADDAQGALSWDPHFAPALVELAERPMNEDQKVNLVRLAEAQKLAQRALILDPLASFALTVLGRIADREGNHSQALALMELAAERSSRDETAQGWLVNEALSRRDFRDALPRLDLIMRTHPELLNENLSLFVALMTEPEAVGSLAQLIGLNPPWRAWFIDSVVPKVEDKTALAQFYAVLQSQPNPPTEREIQPYLDLLVKSGLARTAYMTWISTLPAERRASAATLYNGQFRYPLSGAEFDWQIVQTPGADVSVIGGPARGGMLRVEFSGSSVEFRNVSHLLVLTPGNYHFTGEVEAQSLQTDRGLWWRLSCEDSGIVLGETALIADNTPWRPFALAFAVPKSGCEAQILRLELPARIATEQVIGGVVSFRNLAIVPAQSADAAPGQ